MLHINLTKNAMFGFLLSMAFSLRAQDLLEIYDLALENDPQLKQAQANRAAVGETDNQSLARLLPVLSISAGSSFNRLDNRKLNFQGFGVQEYWNNSFSLNLQQPVLHWDYWVQLDQADNLIAQAEAQYQTELQNLMLRVADAYFNVLAAEDNLQFAVAEKDAIGKQLEQAEQRFAVGLIAITDVHEARAGFDRVKADEITADNMLASSKEKLREIIGDSDVDLRSLGPEIPLKTPAPDDIEVWSKFADAENLSIAAAVNQAEAARKSVEIQRSGHYPTVDLVGSYTQTDNNSTFGLRGDQQNIGLQLNVPLFAGGAVNSRTRQAQHQYEQAKEKLVQTRRAVNREAKDAYRGMVSSASRVEALKAAVVSAESALAATSAGFEVGTRTMVDVLHEQRNLYQAKRDYARTRYDYLLNGIKLRLSASNLLREDLEAINALLSLGKN